MDSWAIVNSDQVIVGVIKGFIPELEGGESAFSTLLDESELLGFKRTDIAPEHVLEELP